MWRLLDDKCSQLIVLLGVLMGKITASESRKKIQESWQHTLTAISTLKANEVTDIAYRGIIRWPLCARIRIHGAFWTYISLAFARG